METLVVVSQFQDQCYDRVKPHAHPSFSSSPSSPFRDINCRTFQSGGGGATGILPTPFGRTFSTPPPSSSASPKTPSPALSCQLTHFSDPTPRNPPSKTSPIPIARKPKPFHEDLENLPFSELWAGPAYSNSPPPSSLPIPKFFIMRPKRAVSLDLPASDPGIQVHPIAKSAPASPSREHSSCTRDLFLTADSATKTLRRILHLDLEDD